jgi:hypothetical protein
VSWALRLTFDLPYSVHTNYGKHETVCEVEFLSQDAAQECWDGLKVETIEIHPVLQGTIISSSTELEERAS